MRNHKALLRQLVSYGAIGFLQIGLDWLTFVTLTFFNVPATPANISGRILGASVGFWLNGKWTFAEGGNTALSRQALARYLATWLFTTALSTLVVSMVDHSHGLHWAWVVKPVSDAVLAAVAFTISKFWVYR